MRSSTETIDDAIENVKVAKFTARLTTWKSRVYFDEYEDDNVASIARPVGDTDNPLPEAVWYDTSNDKLIALYIDYDNQLVLQVQDDDAFVLLDKAEEDPIISDQRCRPSIQDGYILYYDAGEELWMLAEIDVDLAILGIAACMEAPVEFYNNGGSGEAQNLASAYLVSENEAVFLRIDEGAVRATFVDSTGNAHLSPGRFFNPTQVLLTSEDDDLYKLHYATAVKALGAVFVYFTGYNGSVQVYRYLLADNDLDGTWSDIKTAFPEDLSIFEISNGFTYNDKIYICGRFKREEEFASSSVYTLLPWSIDGFIFSLDRKILCSIIDLRFMATKTGDNLTFWSTGRYASESAPYQILGESAPSIVTKIISLNGNPSTGWTASLISGKEEYLDNEYIRNGAYSKIEIGIRTTIGTEWIKYHDVVVANRKIALGDAIRDYDVSLVPDGLWHTSVMTHPLYMEVVGKQALLDEALQLENLYKSGGNDGIQWPLASDLWSEENTPDGQGFQPQAHEGSEDDDYWGPDLTQICTDYPEFGDEAEYEIKLYGWSRAGQAGIAPKPEPPDPTPTSTLNDSFYALVLYEDDDGDQHTIVSEIGDLVSDHANPPQTYFEDGARDGSYPVIYTIPNPGEGMKIIKLGMRVSSPEDKTVYLPERVEMPDIIASYINTGTQEGFQVSEVESKWKLVDTIDLQVTSGNDSDGDKVTGTFDTRENYVYLIAIVGEAQFTRAGTTEYIQDADFVASILKADPAYLPLTWRRIYPPGTTPTINSCVEVTSGDHPYFGGPSEEITWEDSIPPGTSVNDGHVYTFHIDESARLENSAIDARYVPYVYGSGSPIEVALWLAGSGVISEIVDGAFKIYVFESPVPFDEFKFYGGDTQEGDEDSVEVKIDGVVTEPNTWVELSSSVPGGQSWGFGVVKLLDIGEIDLRLEVFYEFITELNSGGNANIGWALSKTGGGMHYSGSILDGDSEGYEIDDSEPQGATLESVVWPNNIFRVSGMLTRLIIEDDATVGSGAALLTSMNTGILGTTSVSRTYRARWWIAGVIPNIPQVPVPPSLSFTIPAGNIDFEVEKLSKSITNRKKGVPQALLAVKPYSAWNYDVIGRYRIVGEYSIAGLIGLSTDAENFIVGYIVSGGYGIAKIRNGIRTTIYEAEEPTIEENKLYDVRFWHRDGRFGIEVKTSSAVWPTRGSMLEYEWQEADGAIATNDDIYHVGVYSIIDPPKFRITGFRSGQNNLPVLPPDINPLTGLSDFSELFPENGKVDVDGVIYNYTGKVDLLSDAGNPIMGPYQHRNITSWGDQFARDLSGSHTFQGGIAMEFTQFNWWEGSDHADDFAGCIIGVNSGYNWINDETQWKVWITTKGIVVYVRNRARYYSDEIIYWYGSLEEKIWVTNGLTGLTPELETGEIYVHNEGAFAFIHSEDEIELTGFSACNGDHAQTIRSLLEMFCRIAGTDTSFPGDNVIDTQALGDGEGVTV